MKFSSFKCVLIIHEITKTNINNSAFRLKHFVGNKMQLQEILDSKDRCKAGRAVPAHGLHLLEVEYPATIFDAKCAG